MQNIIFLCVLLFFAMVVPPLSLVMVSSNDKSIKFKAIKFTKYMVWIYLLIIAIIIALFLGHNSFKKEQHLVKKDYKYELKHYEKLANGNDGATNVKKDYKYYIEYLKNQKTKSKEFEDENITEHIINGDKKPYIAIHYRKWSNDKRYRLMNVDIYRHKK